MLAKSSKIFVAALVLAATSLTFVANASAGPGRARSEATTSWNGGRQVEAPPWSFACINDTGYTDCREPMWVYGDH